MWKNLENASKRSKGSTALYGKGIGSLSSSKADTCKLSFKNTVLILTASMMFAGSLTAQAQIPEVYVQKIADAIYVAEGGKSASVPYGIKSVKCSSESSCRRICENTIKNNFKRWEKTGGLVPFLEFLGSRYSPGPANKNWLPNVRRILNSQLLVEGLQNEQTRRFFETEFFEVAK